MMNIDNTITTDIAVYGEKLKTAHQFKCTGAIISNEGLRTEILTWFAQTKTALAMIKTIWRDKTITMK